MFFWVLYLLYLNEREKKIIPSQKEHLLLQIFITDIFLRFV